MRRPSMRGANANPQHPAGVDNCDAPTTPEEHKHSAAEYGGRVQLHTALQSAVHCKQTLAVAEDSGHFGTEEDQRAVLRHGGEDLQYIQGARGR